MQSWSVGVGLEQDDILARQLSDDNDARLLEAEHHNSSAFSYAMRLLNADNTFRAVFNPNVVPPPPCVALVDIFKKWSTLLTMVSIHGSLHNEDSPGHSITALLEIQPTVSWICYTPPGRISSLPP